MAILLAICWAKPSLATPGYPDSTFGHRGVVKLDLDHTNDVVSADVAGDDQRGFAVVTRSADEHSLLVRLTPSGLLDGSFGDGGVVALPGGPWNAVEFAAGGSIVVAGSRDGEFAIARYSSGGAPDPSLGDGSGQVTTHVQPLPSSSAYFRDYDEPREVFTDLAVEPDGSILAAGYMRLYREAGEEERSYMNAGTAVARFDPDGSLDEGFGEGGTLNTTSASGGRFSMVNKLVPLPGGALLLTGNNLRNLAVLELTAGGMLDPGFGHGGVVISKADTFNSGEGGAQLGDAKTVLVRADGRLVVVGRTTLLGLLPDGSHDPGFGKDGRVFTEDIYGVGINANDGALDSKGRILLAGDNGGISSVARFLPNGHLDRRFGGDGTAETNVTNGGREDSQTDEGADCAPRRARRGHGDRGLCLRRTAWGAGADRPGRRRRAPGLLPRQARDVPGHPRSRPHTRVRSDRGERGQRRDQEQRRSRLRRAGRRRGDRSARRHLRRCRRRPRP